MTHENLLDAATYVWNASSNYDPKLDCFITAYHRESESPYPRISWGNKMGEAVIEQRDLELALYKTDRLNEWIKEQFNLTKEKENKTMATNRELMHSLKNGMLVEFVGINSGRGYVEVFDYTHMLVGVRVEGRPSYANLRWINPNHLRVVALPDGNAVQTLNGPCPKPKRVVYDEEAGITVVLWEDGQKTIVRATEGEQMDVYDAFCAAYCKRVYGTNSALKRELNKILTVNHPKEPEPEHIAMTESFQKLNDGIKKLKDALNGKSDD